MAAPPVAPVGSDFSSTKGKSKSDGTPLMWSDGNVAPERLALTRQLGPSASLNDSSSSARVSAAPASTSTLPGQVSAPPPPVSPRKAPGPPLRGGLAAAASVKQAVSMPGSGIELADTRMPTGPASGSSIAGVKVSEPSLPAVATAAAAGSSRPPALSSGSSPSRMPSRRASSFDDEDDDDLRPVDMATASGGVIRNRSVGCVTINPNKPFRILWETLGIAIIIWVTLSLPFKLAFLTESINDKDPLYVFQVFVNIFFVLDLVLNFYTAYYDENDVLVTDARAIKLHYVKSWFVIDLLAAIPFDYAILVLSDHYYTALEGTKALRILKLLRLFKLLRLHNIYRFFGRFEEYLSNTFVRLFKLGITLILWLHLDACLFFFVARWHELEYGAYAADSWVALNGMVGAPVAEQYLWSIWHASSHMTSISYGPTNPQRVEEVAATLFSMLFGAVLYASIIGTTASIIAASDPSGAEFYRQWDELKVYMRNKEIPANLRDRLRAYFNARWRGRKIFNEAAILDSLPEPYTRSLLLHECQWMLGTVPLFREAGTGFINALIPRLRSRLVMDGEVLQAEGEPPSVWWIVARGIVGLYKDGRRFAELEDGAFFGEVPLLFGVHAQFTAKTETPCQLYAVFREDFEELFAEYADMAAGMKRGAYRHMVRWGLAGELRAAVTAAAVGVAAPSPQLHSLPGYGHGHGHGLHPHPTAGPAGGGGSGGAWSHSVSWRQAVASGAGSAVGPGGLPGHHSHSHAHGFGHSGYAHSHVHGQSYYVPTGAASAAAVSDSDDVSIGPLAGAGAGPAAAVGAIASSATAVGAGAGLKAASAGAAAIVAPFAAPVTDHFATASHVIGTPVPIPMAAPATSLLPTPSLSYSASGAAVAPSAAAPLPTPVAGVPLSARWAESFAAQVPWDWEAADQELAVDAAAAAGGAAAGGAAADDGGTGASAAAASGAAASRGMGVGVGGISRRTSMGMGMRRGRGMSTASASASAWAAVGSGGNAGLHEDSAAAAEAAAAERYRRYFKEIGGYDDDFNILGKLKHGFEQAGEAIRKLPGEIQRHNPHLQAQLSHFGQQLGEVFHIPTPNSAGAAAAGGAGAAAPSREGGDPGAGAVLGAVPGAGGPRASHARLAVPLPPKLEFALRGVARGAGRLRDSMKSNLRTVGEALGPRRRGYSESVEDEEAAAGGAGARSAAASASASASAATSASASGASNAFSEWDGIAASSAAAAASTAGGSSAVASSPADWASHVHGSDIDWGTGTATTAAGGAGAGHSDFDSWGAGPAAAAAVVVTNPLPPAVAASAASGASATASSAAVEHGALVQGSALAVSAAAAVLGHLPLPPVVEDASAETDGDGDADVHEGTASGSSSADASPSAPPGGTAVTVLVAAAERAAADATSGSGHLSARGEWVPSPAVDPPEHEHELDTGAAAAADSAAPAAPAVAPPQAAAAGASGPAATTSLGSGSGSGSAAPSSAFDW